MGRRQAGHDERVTSPDSSDAQPPPTAPTEAALAAICAEIEAHVGQAGWDRAPVLFALVSTRRLVADEPTMAVVLELEADAPAESLTPVEQEDLPVGDLDEVLAQIAWPDEVLGCAVSQEIVLLPPQAEDDLPDDASAAALAAAHPDRREARLVVAVARGGPSAAVLRLRGVGGADDDLLTGAELAPNLVLALLATLD
jgi:hypothetical protein